LRRVQDWSVPLIVAAGAFLVVLVWRVRPLVGWAKGGPGREAMKEAMARVEAATNDAARATALCDAADLSVTGGRGLYLRAVRADPRSVQVVQRAVARLSKRPRALESLLWRHLASVPWTEAREASRASLDALRVLYEGPLRNAVRAKAMTHARDALS
jgi:hypothetical protein